MQWFSDLFALATVDSLDRFFDTIKKHMYNTKINPLWHLMGAETRAKPQAYYNN